MAQKTAQIEIAQHNNAVFWVIRYRGKSGAWVRANHANQALQDAIQNAKTKGFTHYKIEYRITKG